MTHIHHIIPKHMGGTDDSSNLFECSVEQHAELHFALYLEHGHWQDWIASQALSGQITSDEIRRERVRLSNKQRVWTEGMRQKESAAMIGNSHATGHSPSMQVREEWSAKRKGRKWWNDGVNETLAFECPDGWQRGRLNNPMKWMNRDDKGRLV